MPIREVEGGWRSKDGAQYASPLFFFPFFFFLFPSSRRAGARTADFGANAARIREGMGADFFSFLPPPSSPSSNTVFPPDDLYPLARRADIRIGTWADPGPPFFPFLSLFLSLKTGSVIVDSIDREDERRQSRQPPTLIPTPFFFYPFCFPALDLRAKTKH